MNAVSNVPTLTPAEAKEQCESIGSFNCEGYRFSTIANQTVAIDIWYDADFVAIGEQWVPTTESIISVLDADLIAIDGQKGS